ncbi:MAG: serine protease AprX [Actinomycetota bacterium]|jgi:serine protease AprX|nr:serine protease AprX [Actinomycetota bacterium]
MSDRRTTRTQRTGAALLTAAALSVTAAAPAQAGLLGGLLGIVGGTVGVVTNLLDTTTGLLGGADWGYAASATTLPQVAAAINADDMANRGYTGRGVGVALIDTGVVPVQGLTSGNVVNGPDLSLDSQAPQGNLDGFGHGTHMAGIIAGNDAALLGGGFKGIAPQAKLLSVRVGAHDGAADVSQLIAAVDWVVQHRNDNGMNIRVLNLSFGTDGTQSTTLDPLTHAIENAWRAGITVVVSAGNSGDTRPSLDNPARDPFVIAVGADDTHGTNGTADDTIPVFSARGSLARHVDVVAPGQSIESLRNPGSVVDTEYPGARIDTRFFKGSGTSQATAVVSGSVALMLQQRPELTPDNVKQMLMATAQPVVDTPQATGAGLINVLAAANAVRPVTGQSFARSTGLGSLEASRGSAHVGVEGGADLTGEQDIFGNPWLPAVWAPKSSAGTAWSAGNWNGATWAGTCWCTTSYDWTNPSFSSSRWSSSRWSGDAWSSSRWSSSRWSSSRWSSDGWSSTSWSSSRWSGSSWSSASGA